MSKNGRILIVGATGYIGRYLCAYFADNDYDILALGRSAKIKPFFEANNVPFSYFDITDAASFDKLSADNVSAIVVLSACLAEHETPVENFFSVNTLGVYNVLEFARKHNIKKVVVTTSHKVYNDVASTGPISEDVKLSFRGDHTPYIISKIAAENFIEYYNKDFGMNAVALRLTGVHGYGEILGHLNKDGSYKKSTFEIFFEKALRGEPIEVWGDQNIKRDHVYIKDVVLAIEKAIEAEDAKGIFNIASGVGYSQYEEACVIAKLFATKDVSDVTIDESKQGLSRGYVYDISKAEKELGWTPKYSSLWDMYGDYKKEWESKRFRNYHYIIEEQKPLTF